MLWADQLLQGNWWEQPGNWRMCGMSKSHDNSGERKCWRRELRWAPLVLLRFSIVQKWSRLLSKNCTSPPKEWNKKHKPKRNRCPKSQTFLLRDTDLWVVWFWQALVVSVCVAGYIYHPVRGQCLRCPAGTFSDEPNSPSCTTCTKHDPCPTEDKKDVIQPGLRGQTRLHEWFSWPSLVMQIILSVDRVRQCDIFALDETVLHLSAHWTIFFRMRKCIRDHWERSGNVQSALRECLAAWRSAHAISQQASHQQNTGTNSAEFIPFCCGRSKPSQYNLTSRVCNKLRKAGSDVTHVLFFFLFVDKYTRISTHKTDPAWQCVSHRKRVVCHQAETWMSAKFFQCPPQQVEGIVLCWACTTRGCTRNTREQSKLSYVGNDGQLYFVVRNACQEIIILWDFWPMETTWRKFGGMCKFRPIATVQRCFVFCENAASSCVGAVRMCVWRCTLGTAVPCWGVPFEVSLGGPGSVGPCVLGTTPAEEPLGPQRCVPSRLFHVCEWFTHTSLASGHKCIFRMGKVGVSPKACKVSSNEQRYEELPKKRLSPPMEEER